ncbi:MAG: hypothetical protein DWH78_07320 [Planctomycetota bacterium]|nr:MAG: hypothetical protein DWH78_07320 [Planctomycetota bacterium]
MENRRICHRCVLGALARFPAKLQEIHETQMEQRIHKKTVSLPVGSVHDRRPEIRLSYRSSAIRRLRF